VNVLSRTFGRRTLTDRDEIERLQDKLDDMKEQCDKDAAEALRRRDTLREALVKYGAHEKCPCQFGSRGERIPHPRCGLDKALALDL